MSPSSDALHGVAPSAAVIPSGARALLFWVCWFPAAVGTTGLGGVHVLVDAGVGLHGLTGLDQHLEPLQVHAELLARRLVAHALNCLAELARLRRPGELGPDFGAASAGGRREGYRRLA